MVNNKCLYNIEFKKNTFLDAVQVGLPSFLMHICHNLSYLWLSFLAHILLINFIYSL